MPKIIKNLPATPTEMPTVPMPQRITVAMGLGRGRRKHSRVPFTPEEDRALLRFVRHNPHLGGQKKTGHSIAVAYVRHDPLILHRHSPASIMQRWKRIRAAQAVDAERPGKKHAQKAPLLGHDAPSTSRGRHTDLETAEPVSKKKPRRLFDSDDDSDDDVKIIEPGKNGTAGTKGRSTALKPAALVGMSGHKKNLEATGSVGRRKQDGHQGRDLKEGPAKAVRSRQVARVSANGADRQQPETVKRRDPPGTPMRLHVACQTTLSMLGQ